MTSFFHCVGAPTFNRIAIGFVYNDILPLNIVAPSQDHPYYFEGRLKKIVKFTLLACTS